MKRLLLLLAWSAGWFALAAGALAQSYQIDRFAVSGGGGTSTGGFFTVIGTIGQADAGNMSGGAFRVTGGFWSVLGVIQTPGAPFLSVTRSNTNVIISWPAPSTGFGLEENPETNTTNWISVAAAPATVGDEKRVILNAPAGRRYYRLRKP